MLGTVHGVFHSAGLTEASVIVPISELTETECVRQLAAKVNGTQNLEKALRANPAPDFVMLMSSTNAIFAGSSLLAYNAANLYQDMFAYHMAGSGSWVSVNWGRWRGFGKEATTGVGADIVEKTTMSSDAGMDAIERVLSSGFWPHIVASPMLEVSPNGSLSQAEVELESVEAYERPELDTDFVPPRNELEEQIAGFWSELLGIENIGVHDDFFELGGHSLIAGQFANRIRSQFGVELPFRILFEEPTVEAIARNIERSGTREDPEAGKREIERIQSMSPEEVRRELAAELESQTHD